MRDRVTALRRISIAAAAYGVIGGGVTFAGWATGTTRLTDWTGGGITMKANAALAATLAGAALLAYASTFPWRFAACRVLGALVALIGGITLLEHLTLWDAGIDTLLFDEPSGASALAGPGRMGLSASASLAVLGIAIVLLAGGARSRSAAVALALFALAAATLSLTGYWFGTDASDGVARVGGVPAQATTTLAAVAIGVIAADPTRQPARTLAGSGVASTLARRLLPLVIVLPFVLGWLLLRGERYGLYDSTFGNGLRTLLEVTLLSAFVWWSVRAIHERDLRRRRAEQDLRDSERRLSRTLASITDGFVAFDREWRFTYVNDAAERLLGKPQAELLGREVWAEFPQMAGSMLREQLERAARDRVPLELESEDGSGRWFSNRVYPTEDGGLSVYFQDITLRKQAQEALEEADRRKDRFIATLAHELRNPLAPIRNAAGVLAGNGSTESTVRWAASVIGRQAQHMARLLEDLLDVSRITLNRLELRKQWVDLGAIVRAAVDGTGDAVDAAGHELTVDLPAEPIFVNGDPVRLTQVFSNLLSNAAKYTRRGGHIRVTLRAANGDATVSVRDDGIGIPPEMLRSIFEMFVQARSALPHSQGGLGIGLWLASAIVDRHGGRIDARSDGPGRGSEFIVRLPRIVEVVVDAPPLIAEPPPGARRRVLVVDDLEDSADSLAALLKSLGHDAEAAYSGAAALDAAAREPWDAILLDLGMPGMDGFETCRLLRATAAGRRTFIVAVTGWGQPEDRRRTSDAGFDHHLIKPVDAVELAGLLAALPSARASA